VKKTFVIFTAVIILVSSMSNAVLYAEYKLNQAKIERLYCVNKAEPQKQCHGKCHLSKQLQANNKHDGSATPLSNLEESFKLNLYHLPLTALPSKNVAFINLETPNTNQVYISRLFGKSLFRPPDSQLITC
jgi:hypothetical protein